MKEPCAREAIVTLWKNARAAFFWCIVCVMTILINIERGELMVEFDSMKITLSDYEKPLIEMGNSL